MSEITFINGVPHRQIKGPDDHVRAEEGRVIQHLIGPDGRTWIIVRPEDFDGDISIPLPSSMVGDIVKAAMEARVEQ